MKIESESSSNPDTDVPMYIAISFYVKNLYLSIHIFFKFVKNNGGMNSNNNTKVVDNVSGSDGSGFRSKRKI